MNRRYAIVAIIGFATAVAVAAALYAALNAGLIWFVNPSVQRYPVRGIDVSHHQGAIDWRQIPGQGMTFAYIKATEGGDFRDPRFVRNWREARAAGLAVGAYHFFTLCTGGAAQARNFIAALPREDDSLPPVVDLEFTGNCRGKPSAAVVRREIMSFLALVDAAYGRRTILYVTYDFMEDYPGGLYNERDVWIRDIFKHPNTFSDLPWRLWQFHCRARLRGIAGPVDVNVFNGSTDAFGRAMTGVRGRRL